MLRVRNNNSEFRANTQSVSLGFERLIALLTSAMVAVSCSPTLVKEKSSSSSGSSGSSSGSSSSSAAATASLSVSDGVTYDFGNVVSSSTQSKTFTVTNSGTAAALLGTVTTAGLSLAAPYTLTGGTCSTGATLAVAGTCTLIVQFAPTANGAANDTIVLSYNDGSANQTATRAMTGVGLGCTGGSSTYNAFGTGTASDPFRICEADQLADLGNTSGAWDKHFVLTANIDMTGYTQANFTRIGTSTTLASAFRGTFDGYNHTISNFSYSDAATDNIGLFGVVKGSRAVIKNVVMTAASVTGKNNVGGLVGYLYSGQVLNSSVAGTVNGTQYVGGLVGVGEAGAIISTSRSSATVGSAGNPDHGGLVGVINNAYIYNSYTSGTVNGSLDQGGLLGFSYRGLVINSFSSATVNATGNAVGGLVGNNFDGRILNSFGSGTITGNGAGSVGVLVGTSAGASTITNSYYYSQGGALANCTNNAGGGCNATGTGPETTLGDFYLSASAPLSSWDFVNVWQTNGGAYPSANVTWLDTANWGTCATHLTDTPFAGGVGSIENPYLLCDKTHFKSIGDDNTLWTGKAFKLADHIDLTGYTQADLTIIGDAGTPFAGIFDGNGKVLANYAYSNAATDYSGIIGNAYNASVRNLGVEGLSISTHHYTGGIVGYMRETTILDSYTEGSITGHTSVGGIVGYELSARSMVQNVYSTATVNGAFTTGGIGGTFGAGILTDSFFAGDVIVSGNTAGPISSVNGAYGAIRYDSQLTCTNCDNATGTSTNTVATPTYFFNDANAPLSNWNFSNIWLENAADYPSLR
ncbi:MAG: choice-of-anchor D domain-containing protein [Bdellovibrionota bacterium]